MSHHYLHREPRGMRQSNEGAAEILNDTLGLEGAARMMRLGLEAMKELVDKGEIPAVRLNQKHTVMLREDLTDFLRTEGRRQAAERKEVAIGGQTAATSSSPSGAKHGSRRRRLIPPDLRAYERE
ncbi:hypothetical protein KX724_07665 [Stenotrophomonas indicatrix]|uniref:hypothetical protein n=1 Tax=Stenotrophomonas indicatrix TaxID=2045451 RepID=UPI001C4F8198|nr:hypothetical protein [Stenotrophomonas indicatrix]QXQ03959.1 hypothetical protein KX724_07665 [Stenotrophomonas indicatrix]